MQIPSLTPAYRRILVCLLASALAAFAAPPDLTNGGVPGDTISFNMGPTGARGWVYHVRENSSESRQIQVRSVANDTPAANILAANDVILGANGTGSAPTNFTYDARRALADSINDAEARAPATLQLIRWRAGTTSIVTLTLRTMGSYSATAPYNCPKSALILEEGLQFIVNNNETAGSYSFGTLSLIAGNEPSNPNNATRRARAQTQARAMVPNASVRAQMMSDLRDTTGMVTWERGHTLIMLAEYFLLTNDATVLPGIEAYAVNIAKNTSMFGTTGHMYARKNPDGSANGALGNGYGSVNSATMPCYLGLHLAKKCGLTNPEIDHAIQRSSRFYAYYAGKGAIPYGEHEAYWQAHENNGKSGLAALIFTNEPSRLQETRFFTRMAVAASSERGEGHTGAFFNYLWSPLGAAVGGQEAAVSHFARIRWMLDLNRKWNGSFDYDCLSGEGPNSGSQYNDFRMSTAALLTYALPLRQLHITGKSPNSSHILDVATVTASAAVDGYNPDPLTIAQLIIDLGNWSPMVQREAAIELATRSINTATLAQITALANDTNGSSRYGACATLGRISSSTTAAARANTLVGLLSATDPHVRFMAADAMRSLPQTNKSTHLNTIMALCASQARPLLPFPEEDPMQLAHGRLCFLFTNIINSSISGVNRPLLYPAIRAVAYHPTGYVRAALPGIYNKLNQQETLEIADAIVDSIHQPIPADRMFGKDTQAPTLAKLAQYKIAEVVPLSKAIINREDTTTIKNSVLSTLQTYGVSATTVRPDPQIIAFLEVLRSSPDTAASAQAVLNAILAGTSPLPATPLKSLPTISVDASSLTLPNNQTTLRCTSFDHAKGDSVFTWRKVHGKGNVTVTPNGTATARDASVVIDAQPGKYLFEVTLSDSRGLTEITRTVPVTLFNSSGTLPPNGPPVANAQAISVPRNLATPILLTGSDPDSDPLTYRVINPPTQGFLTGTLPDLSYVAYSSGIAASDSITFEVMDTEGQVDSAIIDIQIDNSITAGAITWSSATNTTSPSNIVTTGTLVASRTGHDSSGTIAVNGVNFAPGRILSMGGEASTACPDTGTGAANIALESLLDTISWNGSSFQLTGLTAGSTYLIQMFLCDYRATVRNMILGDNKTPQNTVTLSANPPGAFGQFVTGTFTAAGPTQTITVVDSAGGVAHLNAWQLRLLPDTAPPNPNPATWAIPPTANGFDRIQMAASPALDTSGVEYFFDETSGNPGGTDSGWQDGSSYIDTGLQQATTYTYLLRVRDKSTSQNESTPADARSATTDVPDTFPPQPNPSTWEVLPTAISPTEINMTATTATDLSGVEYYFDETTGNPGASDSGWQDAPAYTDTGLTPGTTYTYIVRARDKSLAQNLTAATTPLTLQTPLPPPTVWNVNFHNVIATTDNFVGVATENTLNSTWNRIGGATNSLPVTARPLADSSNSTAAGVTINLSVTGFGGAARTNTATRTFTGAPKIFEGYVGGDVTTTTLQINGLNPSRAYDLVIYSDWFFRNGGDSGLPVSQTSGSGLGSRIFVNRQNVGTNGTIVPLAQDIDPANVVGNTNWYRITNLTPSTGGQLAFSIGAFGNDPGERSNTAFNGFQLIEFTLPPPSDYSNWSAIYAPANLTNPADDFDGDGMSNFEERAFGLNPTVGASVDPIVVPLNPTAGTFTYTRRNPALTNLSYTVWTSTTLGGWVQDSAAVQIPGLPDTNGIQNVAVTLTPVLLGNPTLFVRVFASGSEQ